MVAYIVLLVLNVLAVVQTTVDTTAMNIQQVNFISQGQGHNIEVAVGGGDGTKGGPWMPLLSSF
jgi:predicted S18 family serine protease